MHGYAVQCYALHACRKFAFNTKIIKRKLFILETFFFYKKISFFLGEVFFFFDEFVKLPLHALHSVDLRASH